MRKQKDFHLNLFLSQSTKCPTQVPPGYANFVTVWNVTSVNSLTLAINIYSETYSSWPYALGEALAERTSLKSLTLAINIYSDIGSFSAYALREALAESTSLKSLTLAINIYSDSDSHSQWGYEFLYGLEKMKSLTEYNFTFNIYGKWKPQSFVKTVEKWQAEDFETEG